MVWPKKLAKVSKTWGKHRSMSGAATFDQTCLAAGDADLHHVDFESFPPRRRQIFFGIIGVQLFDEHVLDVGFRIREAPRQGIGPSKDNDRRAG